MRIESIETVVAEKWMFVVVSTDTGLRGVGEGGLWSMPKASEAAVQTIAKSICGRDPLAAADIWQSVYRFAHFRGAAIGAALSAVDIALWDIAGQYYGVPTYKLLGGPTRSRVRLYVHLRGSTPEELASSATHAASEGFTAVRLDPLLTDWPVLSVPRMLAIAVEKVGAVREAVGSDIDICVECHFKLTPALATELAWALRQFNILFMEDPLPPESPQATGRLSMRLGSPVAAGERLHTLEEFDDLMAAGSVAYIRPDLSLAGGFTQGRKIAALAEARGVGVVPHNFLSPLSTVICAHYAAAISPSVLLEYLGDDVDAPRSLVLQTPIVRRGGYLELPEGAGLGAAIDVDALRDVAPLEFQYDWQRQSDGSVVDH